MLAAVVHGLRERASNRKIAAQWEAQAIELLKQPEWHDFGPTFAAEQLAQRHQVRVSDETLRQWMIRAGLWKKRTRKTEAVHCCGRAGARSESWCSGTPPSTTGWKDADRCVILCA